MRERLKEQWFSVPAYIRKPVIFIVGFIFIIAAGLTGWLPGPGGIPLFLVGVAILSTEFKWAKKLRDFIMGIVHACARWYRRHRKLGLILLTLIAVVGASLLFVMMRIVFRF